MFYIIYRITNIINKKIYIGKHQTNSLDDGYYGSGKHLKQAISDYGLNNFYKEILFIFDTEKGMNDKERELVTEEFCSREDTYNICPGGYGGWGYVNSSGLRTKGHTKEMYDKISNSLLGHKNPSLSKWLVERHKNGIHDYKTFLGKHHTEETKLKIGQANSKLQMGKNNSQFDTMWITDGINNKKIKKIDVIPEGWYKGRKL